MKNKISISILAIALLSIIGCNNQTPEEKAADDATWSRIHGCTEMPEDIKALFPNGTNLVWDCEWQACYNSGDVEVMWTQDSSKVFGLRKISAY